MANALLYDIHCMYFFFAYRKNIGNKIKKEKQISFPILQPCVFRHSVFFNQKKNLFLFK